MSDARPLLSDCPSCRVEGALLEVYVGTGLAEAGCRLCGYSGEDGSGRCFTEADEVLDALAGWAESEGEEDLETFCEANFNGLPSFEVALRVLRGERVETGFDVIAFLFPRAALGATIGPGGRAQRPKLARPELAPTLTLVPWEEPPAVTGRVSTAPAPEPALPPPPRVEPADIARALWAVALADGRTDPREDVLIARLLTELGAPSLLRADARLWRPNEVGAVASPERVLDAMERVARVDGELDRSEIRVLHEYARRWAVVVRDGRWSPPDALSSFWSAVTGG